MRLRIDGILLTMVDNRTNNAKSIITSLRSSVIGNGTKTEEEAILVAQHLCKVRGLLFDTVSFKDSAEGVCRGVKKAFQGAHIYITSDNDDDVRTAHRQFFRWKKC